MGDSLDEETATRQKLQALQQFVPLLTEFIEDLAKRKDGNAVSLIQKFRHLKHVLTSKNSKPKLSMLLQCEKVLSNLREQKLRKKSRDSASSTANIVSQRSGSSSNSYGGSPSYHHDNQPHVSSTSNIGIRTEPDRSPAGISHRRQSGQPDSSTDVSTRNPPRRDSVEWLSPERPAYQASGSEPRYQTIHLDDHDRPSSPDDIVIEREIRAPRRIPTDSVDSDIEDITPRSPSPPPDERRPREKVVPKLIPLEPLNSNLLSLPMPPSGEDDLRVESIYERPTDPRPKNSKNILKSREKLQKFMQTLTMREQSEAEEKNKSTPILAGAHNFTMVGELQSTKYKGPVTVKDYGHRSGSPMGSEYEEAVYSPDNVNFGNDEHDDDDENIEDRVSPEVGSEERSLPPPNVPSFNLPPPPTTNILSTDDLESLVTTLPLNVAAPNMSRTTSQPISPPHRNIPKTDNFIPARTVLNRVPSHIMAAKRPEANSSSSSVSKPTEAAASRDPRKKASSTATSSSLLGPAPSSLLGPRPSPLLGPVPAPLLGPGSSFNNSANNSLPSPSNRPTEMPNSFIPPAPVEDKPLWGINPVQLSGKSASSSNSTTNKPPPLLPSISLPPIVTPDGRPIAPPPQNNYNSQIPVIGSNNFAMQSFSQNRFHMNQYHYQQQQYQQQQQYHQHNQQFGYNRFPHHQHQQYAPPQQQQQQQQQKPRVALTYAEHKARKVAEEAAKKKAEEELKAQEAAAAAAAKAPASSNQKITPTSNQTKKLSIPLTKKPPTKKPLTQLIDAQPLPQHITAPPKKKSDSKSKTTDEKVKSEVKAKLDEKFNDAKQKKECKESTSKSASQQGEKKKLHERRNSSDKKGGDPRSKDPCSSTDKKDKPPERRLSADDSQEKYVDKSLEKVSPLGSLYGEMPGPKVGLGYGKQVFKIPRKPIPRRRTPTPPPDTPSPEPEPELEPEPEDIDVDNDDDDRGDECDVDAPNLEPENPAETSTTEDVHNTTPEAPILTPMSPVVAVNDSPGTSQQTCPNLTQEQIELYIRKSFESGEAKKLLEESTKIIPLLQKINDPKKLAKIRKIIESESESEEEDTAVEEEKAKKKKSVKGKEKETSVSDSSDDEPLASKIKQKKIKPRVIQSDSDDSSDDDNTEPVPEPLSEPIPGPAVEPIPEPVTEPVPAPAIESISELATELISELATEPELQKPSEPIEEKLTPPKEKQGDQVEPMETDANDEPSPPKKKSIKRPHTNELDRLQADIREMFISEGVLAATGPRRTRPVCYSTPPCPKPGPKPGSKLRRGRKPKKDVGDKNTTKDKRDSSDHSVIDEVEAPTPSEELDLPPVFVRLERIFTYTDEDTSRSVTPNSDRSSRTSSRNVARRGKRRGPNIGSRESTTKECRDDLSIESDSNQHDTDYFQLPSTSSYDPMAESVERASSERSDSVCESIASDVNAFLESESPPQKSSKKGKGKRGRKSAWQKGVTTNKKSTGKKPLTAYAERAGGNKIDQFYYIKEDNSVVKCLICMYDGKRIVDHYLTHHPEEEVLISRISLDEFNHALQQPPNVPPPAMVMTCRFCFKEELEIQVLYDHVTEHTGEYRYKCPKCDDFIRSAKKSVVYHMSRTHPEISYPDSACVQSMDGPHVDSTFLSGYVCAYCRFTQLSREKVEKHVERWHRSEKGIACPPGLEEVSEVNLAKWVDNTPHETLANESMMLNERTNTSEVIVPKSEVDEGPSAPLDLPTLNRYEDTPAVDPLNVSIKKEPQDDEAPKSSMPPPAAVVVKTEKDTEELANMDIQATLSSLEELLHEAPNNPKSLLETIRSKRYESMGTSTSAAAEVATPSSVPVVLAATASTSQISGKSSRTRTTSLVNSDMGHEDEASSEDENINMALPAKRAKQSNLLKADLIEKLKSSITVSRLSTDTQSSSSDYGVSEDRDPLGDDNSNPEVPSPVASGSGVTNFAPLLNKEPTTPAAINPTPALQRALRKHKLTNELYKCFACDLKTQEVDSLVSHMENSHILSTSGWCSTCSLPLKCRDEAVKHFKNCHKGTEEPSPSNAKKPLIGESEEEEVRATIRLKPISLLLANQPSTSSDSSVSNSSPTVQESAPSNPQSLLVNNILAGRTASTMPASQPGTFQSLPAGSRILLGPRNSISPAPTTNVPPNSAIAKSTAKKTVTPIRLSQPKMASAPLYAQSVKDNKFYESMLIPSRLRHQYKCLGVQCNFSSDNKKRFIRHFNQHVNHQKLYPSHAMNAGVALDSHYPNEENKLPSWKQCVYCCKAFSSAEIMIDHIAQMHNNCVYQCAHCFYRSASKSNVTLHQTQGHQELRPQILMCSDNEPSMEETLPAQSNLLGNLVMPYICMQNNCARQFYNRDIFSRHLIAEHNRCSLFQCHVCRNHVAPQLLLEHYKVHSYHEFQCMICRHGTDTQEEMHRHLYVEHANYTACLLVRSMIGAKSKKNVLQGALRRLEMANITVVNVLKDPQDEKDPDDSEDEGDTPGLLLFSAASSSAGPSNGGVRNINGSGIQSGSGSTMDTDGDSEADLDSMVTRSKSTASAASSEKEDEGQDTTDIELDGHKLYLCSNKGCGVSWGTADELSEHLMVCDMTRDSTALCCVHCGRTFRQIPNLIDHLRNMHGPKRFTCGVCTDEFRVSCLANMYRHFKTKHKSVATVLKPVDPFKNNQDTDKFIVQLKHASPVKSSPKKVSRLNTFSPSEIEQLPKQPIFQTHVQCSECNFSDRVRSNVIRHLKSHIEDKEITRAAPINPMPCLDSRERHFDKMTNWAGSSHRNPDGTLKPPPKRRSGLDLSTGELEKLPRLIPPSCRYVCGADSCAYLTTDLDMLTLHVKNLHAQDSVYTCPHCTNPEPFTGQGTIFERGLAHLRMHGDRLYRCSICQYHHYTRRVVEKHLEEKHDEYPESVLTIREPDTPEFESSPIVNHTWLCSECGFTCHSNDDIRNHCKTEHNIKSQYRCSLCNIRSSGIPTIEQHFSSKHPRENVLMYASYYRSDMSDNKILVGVPTVETHGELINPVPIKPSPAAPAPVEKIKLIRQILVEEVETPLPNSTVVTAPTATSVEKRRSSKEIFEADLIKKFGPLGKPIGSLYSCPICQRFKSKYKHCLRDHLFREFHHKKYICKTCSTSSTSHSIIRKHLQQVHGVHKDFLKNVSNSKDNPHLEEWVKRVLEHQHSSMFDVTEESPNEKKAIASTLKTTVEPKTHLTKVNVTTPTKLAHATPSSPPKQQSLLKSPSLRQSPRSLLKPQLQPVTPEKVAPAVENVETTTIDLDDDDEDRPLVIEEDTDEDTKKEVSTQRYTSDSLMKETSTETAAQKGKKGKGQWECKHCHRRFKMAHGLKMHIKLYHYGLGTWQCGYCPATMTSEHVTLLHCRASHPEQPEKAVKNTKQKVTLDNEFWEREYGIVHGTAPIETTEEPPGNYNKKCQYCSYTTNLSATLKLHEMRHWVQKPFGCGYCKFQGVSEYNMKTHCAKLHPDLPVKVITNSLPNKPQIKPLKRIKRRTSVKVAAQTTPPTGGDNDLEILEEVEEESSAVDKNQTESDTSTTAPPAEPAMLYRCFYCPRKSLKLPDIHQHWLSKHKNPDNSESPFRYKSIPLPEVLQNKDPSVIKNCVCAYCDFKGPMNTLKSHHLTWHPDKDFKIVGSKKSSFKCSHCDFTAFTVTALKLHIETKHPSEHFNYQIQNRPVTVSNLGTLAETSPVPSSSKYLCLWCNETCENREKIDLHNKCFHSHLEPKFEPVPLTVTNPPLPIAKSEVPASTATLPSISINPNRRLFLCPDCPHKTMTLRVMRAHVSKIHVKELECPQCGIVLADKKAAIMHIYVEHPKLDKSKTLMPKCKAKVDHKMLFVKREGEDEKHDFCEVNITDILSKQTSPINESPPLPSTLFPESSPSNSSLQPEPTYSSTNSILQPESTCSSTKSLLQLESMRSSTNSLLQPGPRYLSTNSMLQSESRSEPSLSESAFDSSLTSPPSKKRCVAKKSTSKPCKNTARKSFPSSSWSPLLMVDTEESSEYESEDEGQSAYIHPSEREALQPLSTMPHLSTELNVGTSAPITVTVDKLALLMNLEPKVKVSDLKN